jgi:hypothetical protein|tara:strand:- start:20 stop:385 length:366 start_codon:yes stop_codon:yes gene_type:complete
LQINDVERIAFYNDWFPLNFFFSISIGFLAILKLIYKKLFLSISKLRIIILFIFTIISGIIFWQLKIHEINNYLKLNPNKNIDFDDLELGLYWLIGLIAGCIVCLGILHFLKIKKLNKNIC